MLFQDIAEQEHVFALLDELACQPNQRAATKFSVQDNELMKRIVSLSIKIHDYEKELKFDPNKISYQRARVNYLWDKLERADRADKLSAELTEIKELLLKAWAINLEMLCGRMKPLADKGKEFTQAGRQKGAVSEVTVRICNLAKDNRTLSAKELFAKADKTITTDMAFDAFRSHVSRARKQYKKEKKSNK